MKIIIFTRADDQRLPYMLRCFEKEGVKISLIVISPPKTIHMNWKRRLKKIIYKRNTISLDVMEYPVVYVSGHNSDETLSFLLENKTDVIFISKTGILQKKIIEGPWKIINCHPGILPRYRGKGSCEWAIYEKSPLGVTAHYIDMGIDTGPIILREYVEPNDGETVKDFRNRLDEVGSEVMASIARRLANGEKLNTEKQIPEIGVLHTRKPLPNELPYIEAALKERTRKQLP